MNTRIKAKQNLLILLVILSLNTLLACGGGSADDDDETETNLSPTATAPADFEQAEQTSVSLDGSNSHDSDGTISSFLWSQSAGSINVDLNNENTAIANFDAPAVEIDTMLTFTLTVTDNDGATATDSVVVTIKPDQPPQAVAPADFQAVELTTILLDGSGSSDDVEIVEYLWQQTDSSGQTVNLSNANTATASFTGPEVIGEETLSLSFSLTVTDSMGASHTDSVNVTIIDTPTTVTLSGNITFDLVPHNVNDGLDYNNTIQSNVRGATVQLLNANKSQILDTSTSDASGNYSFEVTPSTSYVIRVRAELKQSGSGATWDFSVVDNTSGQAMYVMDSDIQDVAGSDTTLNLNAPSGWGGTSYTSTRVAAPFAILDSVYQAKQKILSVDPTVNMAALKLNWSVNNVPSPGDTSTGQIGTSHFNGTEIFILGDADNDTDEYDDHVIIHEWGHYFEGRFSRSDSIGWSHSLSDKLDLRVALGEGWGNALSGIVTDDPIYQDSFGVRQSSGFNINVESNPVSVIGWYSEASVQSLIYDLYDANDDGGDSISLGFKPIYDAMLNGEKNTEAFTSIFSFAMAVKAESPQSISDIDNLLTSQSVIVNDEYGASETNDGGDPRNLPVYSDISVGGGNVTVCSYNTNGQYNKLGVRKYLKFTIPTTGSYLFTATGQNSGDDPDIYVFSQGNRVFASETNGNESAVASLNAGNYVMEASDWANADTEGTGKDTCMDIAISAN